MRRLRYVSASLLLVLIGCGGPESPPTTEAADAPRDEATAVATAGDEAQDASPSRRRFLPDEMQRPGGRSDFSHDPHVEIVCSTCHQRVRGHGSHADLRCVQCHATSERATRTDVTAADCLACHHGAQQTVACTSCHGEPAPGLVERTFRLAVWPSPRARRLPFDHARHESERCEACHEERPSLAPTASCGSCHEDHHRPDADCAGCHRPPPSGAHTLRSHTTCSGSGCHAAASLDDIAQTRPVCLACHQSQRDHEPGKECAECHQVASADHEPAAVSAGLPSTAPWRHP